MEPMTESGSPAAPEQARWPRLRAVPDPRLRPLLAAPHAGFTEETGPRHLVLPATTTVTIVLKLRDSAHRPPAFVHGVHERCVAVAGACAPSYLELSLRPLGAFTLLGVPMSELREQLVDLRELAGPPARRLAEQLPGSSSWPDRFALVERFLLARLDRAPQPAPEVRRAWQLIVDSRGAVPIGRVARHVGWSHKHLIHRFTREVGLAPKTAARLVRFEHVLRRLDRPRPGPWVRIAAESGYADQPHLAREFRAFAGTTPAGFLASVGAGPRRTAR